MSKVNISYNKLWKLLIDRNMTKTQFRELVGLSPVTLSKLSKCENVNTETIAKICETLQCDVSDIMEYQKTEVK